MHDGIDGKRNLLAENGSALTVSRPIATQVV
jgi:hypothetical protein